MNKPLNNDNFSRNSMRPEGGHHRETKSGQPNKKKEELEILDLLKGRDPAGLELVMDKYQDKLFAVVNRICANPSDSEEVLQDVFMTVYEKIESFEERSSLSTWLYRIAVNAALMKLRSQRKRNTTLFEEGLSNNLTREGDPWPFNESRQSPHEMLLKKELYGQIAETVENLPDIYQNVFYYRDLQGFSIKETSEMLDASPAAIKSRLHRSRLFIKEGLEPYLQEN